MIWLGNTRKNLVKFTEKKYTDGDFDYDDEVEWSSLSTSAEDVMKKAKILEDEKKKSGMTGTSLDTQSNFHHPSCDEEKTNMDSEDRASEENMATERKKRRSANHRRMGSNQTRTTVLKLPLE